MADDTYRINSPHDADMNTLLSLIESRYPGAKLLLFVVMASDTPDDYKAFMGANIDFRTATKLAVAMADKMCGVPDEIIDKTRH